MADKSGNISTADRLLFKKPCKYVGSIACVHFSKNDRQTFVNEKLQEMKDVGKGVSVVMCVTEEGVKVLHENEKSVKMAHGITRLAFTTSHPDHRMFAYIAKSLTISKNVTIQAHMFKMKKSSHVIQVCSNFSKAFEIAYSKDTIRRKNRVKLFENEALEAKAPSQKTNRGKRWAKLEMARGHENAGHARKAIGNYSPAEVSQFKHELESNAPNDPALFPNNNDKNSYGSRNVNINILESPVANRPPMPLPNEHVQQQRTKPKRTKSAPVYEEIKDPPEHQYIIKTQSSPSLIPQDTTVSKHPLVDRKMASIDENLENTQLNFDLKMKEGIGRSLSLSSKDRINIPPGGIEEVYLCPTDKLPRIPQQKVQTKDRNENVILLASDSKRIQRPQSLSALDYAKPAVRFSAGYTSDDVMIDSPFTITEENQYQNIPAQHASRYDNISKNPHFISHPTDVLYNYYDNRKASDFYAMKEEDILKASEWFQPGLSRDIAEEFLVHKSNGTFLIRDSQSQPGCFVLSMKVPESYKQSKIGNFLIEKTSELEFKIKGYPRRFQQLTDLIAHYSSFEEDIPCKLLLGENSPLFYRKISIDQPDFPQNCQSKQLSIDEVFDPDNDDDDEDDDDEWDDHEYEDVDFEVHTSVDDIMKELEELTVQCN